MLKVAKKLRFEGDNGTVVEVDLDKLQLTNAERNALTKALAVGSIDVLSADERKLIADKRALVHPGDPANAFIARFDISVVRID